MSKDSRYKTECFRLHSLWQQKENYLTQWFSNCGTNATMDSFTSTQKKGKCRYFNTGVDTEPGTNANGYLKLRKGVIEGNKVQQPQRTKNLNKNRKIINMAMYKLINHFTSLKSDMNI